MNLIDRPLYINRIVKLLDKDVMLFRIYSGIHHVHLRKFLLTDL